MQIKSKRFAFESKEHIKKRKSESRFIETLHITALWFAGSAYATQHGLSGTRFSKIPELTQ